MFRRARVLLTAAAQSSGPFDPHKILGVKKDTSPEDIKKAYHKLVLRFHPDGPEGNKERFQAVHDAYEAIKTGTYQPPPPESPDGQGASSGAGRRYVYEEPGSTSDNYVSKDKTLEWRLQLLLVSCFFIVVVRMLMFYAVPRKRLAAQDGVDGNTNNGSVGTNMTQTVNIHDEDDKEWARMQGRQAPQNPVPETSNHVYIFGSGNDATIRRE